MQWRTLADTKQHKSKQKNPQTDWFGDCGGAWSAAGEPLSWHIVAAVSALQAEKRRHSEPFANNAELVEQLNSSRRHSFDLDIHKNSFPQKREGKNRPMGSSPMR